jgi:hypothetical protein
MHCITTINSEANHGVAGAKYQDGFARLKVQRPQDGIDSSSEHDEIRAISSSR